MMYSHAAYRTSAARRAQPGFQGAAPSRPRGSYRPPPSPANDNRKAPKPANDNKPPIASPNPANDNKPAPVKGARAGLSRAGWRAVRNAAGRALRPANTIRDALDLLPGQVEVASPTSSQAWIDAYGAKFYAKNGNFQMQYSCLFNGDRKPPHGVAGEGYAPGIQCLQLQATGMTGPGSARPKNTYESENYASFGQVAIGATVGSFFLANWYYPVGIGRWRSSSYWTRQNPGLDTMVIANPYGWYIAPPLPLINPMIDPNSLPLGEVVPASDPLPYKAIPHRRANPRRSPTERSSRGPRIRRSPAIAPRLRPWQRAMNQARVDIAPGQAPRLALNPGGARAHPRVPPGPRERERKGRIGNGPLGALNRAVGGITEAMDLVNAIWFALDPSARSRGFVNPAQKAADIWNNPGAIDLKQAVINILLQQATDYAIGRVSRKTASGIAKQGFDFPTTGLQRALNSKVAFNP